jgi:hypothetical protein
MSEMPMLYSVQRVWVILASNRATERREEILWAYGKDG